MTTRPSETPARWAAGPEIGSVAMPKLAWVTVPVAMISWATVVARLTGMAKPSPMLPPPLPGMAAPADGTPIS